MMEVVEVGELWERMKEIRGRVCGDCENEDCVLGCGCLVEREFVGVIGLCVLVWVKVERWE